MPMHGRRGFCVFNTVIDKRARSIAVATYSFLTVAVPLLAGLVEFDAMEAEIIESDLLAIGNASGAP